MFSDLPDWRNIKGAYLFKEDHKHTVYFPFRMVALLIVKESIFKLWMGWEESKKKKKPVVEGGEKIK